MNKARAILLLSLFFGPKPSVYTLRAH